MKLFFMIGLLLLTCSSSFANSISSSISISLPFPINGFTDRHDHGHNRREGDSQRHDQGRNYDNQRGERDYTADDLICAAGPNETAAPMKISTGKILGAYYFNSDDDCRKALRAARNGIVCVGGHSSESYPLIISTERTVGLYNHDNVDSCNLAVQGMKGSLICVGGPQYDQSAIFNMATGTFIDSNYRNSLESCLNALFY